VGVKGIAAGVAFLILAACASAGSYDDFTRGISAVGIGQYDQAIEAFTAALQAGDLAPVYRPVAYIRRAEAYLQTGRCKEALTDVDAAAQLREADAQILRDRLWAHTCLGDHAAAVQDFAVLVARWPDASTYLAYATNQWSAGDFSGAAANFAKAQALIEKDAKRKSYVALWYAMSALRAGTYDAQMFSTVAASLRSDDWPRPLVDFYLGTATLDAVRRAAAGGDARPAAGQKCETDFYVGEWLLVHGDNAGAEPLIASAAQQCPRNFVEYGLAQNERKRMQK
jgi:tetratricopeptide (TPR) repeat protein